MPLRRARTALVSFAAVAALVGGLAPAAGAAPTLTTLSGTVRAGGAGLGGVTVTVRTPAGDVLASGTTLADGTYAVTDVPSGDRVVCVDGSAVTTAASPAGYLVDCGNGRQDPTQGTPVTIRRSGTTVVNRVIYPATLVTGRLTDKAGNAVVGATVTFTYQGPTATTGADGVYRQAVDARYLDGVNPCVHGDTGVSPTSSAGFVDACFPFPAGQYYQPIRAGQVYHFDQQLAPAATISGRVTDHRGNGLAGVVVIALDAHGADERAVTAADGTYTVTNLPSRAGVSVAFLPQQIPGQGNDLGYLAECWRNVRTNYGCRPGSAAPQGTVITTPTGATRTGIDAVLEDAAGISGRITDSAGRPIAGVPVSSTDGPDFTTGDDGTYRFTHITGDDIGICVQGNYTRNAEAPYGYSEVCRNSNVSGTSIPVQAGRVTTADFVLQGRGGVSGTVLDPSGRPLQGVTVKPGTEEQYYLPTATTGADGTFTVGYLDPGVYPLCFESDDFRPIAAAPLGLVRTCTTVTVDEFTTTALPTVTVQYAGAVSGHLSDNYGFAVSNVGVTATDLATGVQYLRYLDSDYTLAGLPPGRYSVCFDPQTAVRDVDYTRPSTGWATQCWRRKNPADGPTVVTVRPNITTTGIDARFVPKPRDTGNGGGR